MRLLVVGGLLALSRSVLIGVLSSWAIESQSCVCAFVFQLPDACTFGAAFHDRVCHLLHGNSDSDFFRPRQARQDFASVSLCLDQIVDLLFQVIHAFHFSSSACFFKIARSHRSADSIPCEAALFFEAIEDL